ncbi:MAG: T9SS type A sorting domain-containing protein [Chitinophagaceae bacterium]|nr:T9SS type A sorting domain-containing protein [Chitinophagaceae bacterium]
MNTTKTTGTAGLPVSTFHRFIYLLFSAMGAILFFGISSVQAQTTVNFTTSGSHQWPCPVGVSSITVECWGGGGAGGGATGNSNAAAGGGAGGSYVKAISYSVTPGVTYNISVGAGGNGSTGDGTDGGSSWFGSSSTILATGGKGGSDAPNSNTSANGGPKQISGNIGFTPGYSFYGGKGANGSSTSYGGGGGSSAGNAANGNDATNRTGAAAVTGGSAGYDGVTSGSVSGTPGFGGGGGAARATGSTNRSGGDGGVGKVSITYTQLTYKSQILSVDAGATTWCEPETRNVTVQIKNNGTATWTDANPDINIGIKWNTNGANWSDYFVKVDAGGLAPGATGTYVLPITTSNYVNPGGYTTPLAIGVNNISVDVIYEGISNFGQNLGGVGPGNAAYTSPNQDISAAATIIRSSGAGTDAQSVCQNIAIANITYQLGGGATGASVTGLPAGVSGSYNGGTKVYTISGSPTVFGSFAYTVTAEGPCGNNSLPGTIDVTEAATLTLTSAGSTTSQTLCMNSSLTDITYSVGGTGSGGNVTGLPAGVTGTYSSGVVTISGTPTVSGTFNYSVVGTGICNSVPETGSITVNDAPTGLSVSPSSATICVGESESLTGNSSINAQSTIASENFNGTPNVTVIGTSDNSGQVWTKESNGVSVNGVQAFTSPNGGGIEVAMAAITSCFNWGGCPAAANTTMTSASFSTNNLSSVTLSWAQAYKKGNVAGSSATVEISTDNVNWTVLQSYAANVGAANAFASESITLNASYLNQPTVWVRFIFVGNVSAGFFSSQSAWWAIDDLLVNGNSTPLYSWSANTAPAVNGLPGGAGTPSAANATISVSPTQTTSYTLTSYNPITGCSTSLAGNVVTVNQNSTISLSSAPGSDNQILCAGSAVSPITYAVGGGGNGALISGLPPSFQGAFADGTFTISGGDNAAQGTYNYTVTTTGPCQQVSATGTIVVGAPVDAVVDIRNVSVCSNSPDGQISLTPNGGTAPYSYVWTGIIGSGNPANTPYTNGTNAPTQTGLQYGFYNVQITDGTGCVKTISNIHVMKAFLPYITHNGSISSECAPTGTLVIYAAAAIAPYTYSLDGVNYQPSNIFTNLADGNYTIHVKDAGGCENTKVAVVGKALPVTITPYVLPSSSCSNDGKIFVYRNGGIPPYSYSLDDVTYQSSNAFTNMTPGSYTVYVKDSKGCTYSQVVNVPQGSGVSVSSHKSDVSACIDDGSIQFIALGGTAPYTYSLDGVNFQPSNTFINLSVGSYTGTVKDSKGCTGTLNVTLITSLINVSTHSVNASDCETPDGQIQIFVSGGVGPYTYSVDGNNYQASNSFTGLVAGTYDVYVKDSKTCIGVLTGVEVGPQECLNNNLRTPVVKHPAQDLKGEVLAYPNPSNGEFNLQVGQLKAGTHLEVTDILGKMVFKTTTIQKSMIRIGSNWKPGVYFVKIVSGNESQTIRLVKQ